MNGAGLSPARRRGQPIVALLAVIAVWIALRMLFWQSPMALPRGLALASQAMPQAAAGRDEGHLSGVPVLPPAVPAKPPHWQPAPTGPRVEQPLTPRVEAYPPLSASDVSSTDSRPGPAHRTVGHTRLLAAGLTQQPPAQGFSEYLQDRGPALVRQPERRVMLAPYAAGEFARESAGGRGTDRWSADGWVLLRGDTSVSSAAIQPSYGRSQAGGVLRYALAPDNARAPQAYLRATAALEGTREQEAALGLSARPVAGVPVRVAAEARLGNTALGTQARAALLAISELPAVALPAGLTGEAYLQAGYVTGDFATGFVDGLARVTRELASVSDFRLSAGGGAWGGAQRGAQRLDVGPSASVSFALGEGFGRLSAEYRFRVAGEAEPASGPALTLSAGF